VEVAGKQAHVGADCRDAGAPGVAGSAGGVPATTASAGDHRTAAAAAAERRIATLNR